MSDKVFLNPFRPGAGQFPPHLAGRHKEFSDFNELIIQQPILKNLVLTGLRGVGKTVLLEAFKPIAITNEWFWAGTDLSESASVSEQTLAIRVIADLSSITSSFTVKIDAESQIGFAAKQDKKEINLSFNNLMGIYSNTPGLEVDKLKKVLEIVWEAVKVTKVKGIVIAYDEAQNLKDQATDKQYPLSVLIEAIQYLQRKQIPYLLILTGLPTLYPTLVETRTYTERMFHVITLDKLSKEESKEAIIKPIKEDNCPVTFSDEAINQIIQISGGYPYFIQFFCKEVFDSYLLQKAVGIEDPIVTTYDIIAKLDTDFYSGRWNITTDRQKDLLKIIAKLPTANEEFTVQDIAAKAKELNQPAFTPSYINQYLNKLIALGLIYRNSYGKYSFAVPLLANYINRQGKTDDLNF